MYTSYEAKRIRLLVGILYVVQPPMLLGVKYKAMLHMYVQYCGREGGQILLSKLGHSSLNPTTIFFCTISHPTSWWTYLFYYILCISDADNQDKKWICAVGKFNELRPYEYGHNCIRALRNISQFVRIQYT